MPGPRPVLCTFPDDFLQVALDTVSRRTVAIQTVQRFSLVLLLHEQPSLGNEEAAEAVGLSARQVQRWRSRWVAGEVLPGFVWVKIQWSEPFVFKAWGNATAFSVSEALGGRDQQDPQVPPPTPPTPFPSEMWQVRDFLS